MAKYEVGQELRVFIPRMRRQEDEEPRAGLKGEVIKVARKYMTVRYRRSEGLPFQETEFNMEDGKERNDGSYTTYLRYVETPEQVALNIRKQQALEALHGAGLEPISSLSRGRKNLPLEQLEALAEVINTHPAFTQEV